MRRMISLLVLFCVVQCAHSQEAGLMITQANQAYRNGEYAKADTMYEKIVQNGYESPALYYNFGNTRFKLNDVPGAILNFERARRLSPRDEDVVYNLRLANLRVIDKVDPIPEFFLTEWWHEFIRLYSSTTWAGIVIAELWGVVFCAGIVLFLRSLLVRRILLFSAATLFLASILATTGMILQQQYEHTDLSAVIFAQSLSVKSSPDVNSINLFVLHEGVKVQILDNVENWRKIRLPDGKVGWVPSEALQII